MQLVNDDMDDFFKKAAEDYPLQTDGADWNKIQKALAETDIPKQEKKNKRYFLLLFLIPFALICNYYLQNGDMVTGYKTDAIPGTKARVNSNEASIKKESESKINNSLSTTTTTHMGKENLSSETKPALLNVVSGKATHQTKKAGANWLVKKQAKDNTHSKTKSDFGLPNRKNRTKIVLPSIVKPEVENFRTLHIAITRLYPVFSLSANALHKKIVTDEQSSNTNVKISSKKFYAGLSAAAEVNTIKFQKIKDASYNAGIVLGYQFANSWSVESGINFSRKFYYTAGEHYNTSKLYLPPNTSITSVEGFCTMWELPLQLRYSFKKQSRHQWFAAVGTSSYFMKSEDYDFAYYYQQSNRTVIHNRKYNTAYTHLFATLNLSGGYLISIKKIGDLRLEPYLKLPLKSMGTGALYLQSAGLRFTVTRNIF